jgi:hypothetical protein
MRKRGSGDGEKHGGCGEFHKTWLRRGSFCTTPAPVHSQQRGASRKLQPHLGRVFRLIGFGTVLRLIILDSVPGFGARRFVG